MWNSAEFGHRYFSNQSIFSFIGSTKKILVRTYRNSGHAISRNPTECTSRKKIQLEKKNWSERFFLFKFLFRCWRIFFGSILKSLLMILQPKKKSWKMGFRENLFNQPNQSSRNNQKFRKRNFWSFFAESHSYLAPCLTQQRLHGQLPSTHRGCTKVNRIGLGTTKK